MTEPFAALDANTWGPVGSESSGGDEKEWLEEPDGRLWLFKPRTEQSGWSQGEDWAEKVASELAALLLVPAARVELAYRGGRQGSVSLSLRPPGWELQHGALLLGELLPSYESKSRTRSGHTLENIEHVLRSVQAPAPTSPLTAFEVFTGYLVLDALVANQDRHEENWAVLRPLPGVGEVTLAGSYDHGSSLGFNLTDAKRTLELDRNGVPAFAARAMAQRFDQASDGGLTLVDLAHRALARCSAQARSHWLESVAAVDDEALANTVDRVPGLSDPVRRFTEELLVTNRRRLLNEH
jgi:hypothetical protein